jgi:hypothetical protein
MSQRFRPTDAFVDESRRGRRYLMGCVLAQAKDLPQIRSAAESLPTRGRRVHFNNEDDGRRRKLLAATAQLPITSFVVVCQRGHGTTFAAARDACLRAIVEELQERQVVRLVIESRSDDMDDVRTIVRSRSADALLVFEHRAPGFEPALGLADALVWAAGAGGAWTALAAPVLEGIRDVRP